MSRQTDPETQEQNYTMGYSEEFQVILRRRSAASNAAHLLPKLRPGMRVLDVGCGPGTISMGLADAGLSRLDFSGFGVLCEVRCGADQFQQEVIVPSGSHQPATH